jgi:hypothetical protein
MRSTAKLVERDPTAIVDTIPRRAVDAQSSQGFHTFSLFLVRGPNANTNTANKTVTKTCQTVGRREAKQTEANMAALREMA